MNFVLVTKTFDGDYKVEIFFDSFYDAENYAKIWKQLQALKGTLHDYETVFITDELSFAHHKDNPDKIDLAALYKVC